VRLWYAEQLGIELDSYSSAYTAINDYEGISEAVEQEARSWIETDETPQPGDVILWKIGRHWSHVAVMATADQFLHVMGRTGSTCESLASPKWLTRPRRVFRLPST